MTEIIAILSPDDRVGGAEGVLKKIAFYYLLKGFEVHVFFLKKSKGTFWLDLRNNANCIFHYTNSTSEKAGLLAISRNLRMVSKGNNISYTFCSHVHLTALVSLLIKFRTYNTKYFVSRESTMVFERFNSVKLLFFKLLYFISIRHVDLKIFQSDEMLKSFNRHLSFANRFNTIVLHNPVDLFELNRKSNSFIPTCQFPYIVACGRLIQIKGFDQLIEIFGEIGNKILNLVIIGDGPEMLNLKRQVENSLSKERIHLIGHKDNPIPYFKNAYGCVISSKLEGFPNVLLEMMSQNGRVVSTDCAGGIINIPGVILAKKDNPVTLKIAIEQMINSNHMVVDQNFNLFQGYLRKKSVENFIYSIENKLYCR